MKAKTKTPQKKSTTKALTKPKSVSLTALQKIKFRVSVYYYLIWLKNDEDLVSHYVLDEEQNDDQFYVEEVTAPQPEPNKSIDIQVGSEEKNISRFSVNAVLLSVIRRKTLLKTLGIIFLVTFLVTLVQVIYPSSRALPFANLQSVGYVGFSDKSKILNKLSDFDQRIVTVHTHNKNITTGYKDIGVSIDPIATASSTSDYPMSKRLVPFSVFFLGRSIPIKRTIDNDQLKLFIKDVVAQSSKQPVDAFISIEGTKIKVSPSEEGYEYSDSGLRSVVLRSNLANNSQVIFSPTILYPNISSDMVAPKVSRMQQRINSPITINADGKSFNVDSALMAGWLKIEQLPREKRVELYFDQQKVKDSLRPFVASVDYPSKPNVTTLLNGSTAGQTLGETGRTVQFDQLVKQITDATSPVTSTIEASVSVDNPVTLVDRKYSKDSVGAQNLVDYWVSTHSGDYSIDFRTLNGQISARSKADRLYSAVGVYRIYIASLINNKIASHSISSSTVTTAGLTVEDCLQRMIINSDETCTDVLGNLVGWSASDQFLAGQGFTYTTIAQGSALTTAQDTSLWLSKLYAGNITQFSQSNSLLNLMSQQSYRQGIPTGSPGIKVADKTGSFGRINSDIGLVYHPGGYYALSIFSDGSNFKQIADLASEFNKLMNQ